MSWRRTRRDHPCADQRDREPARREIAPEIARPRPPRDAPHASRKTILAHNTHTRRIQYTLPALLTLLLAAVAADDAQALRRLRHRQEVDRERVGQGDGDEADRDHGVPRAPRPHPLAPLRLLLLAGQQQQRELGGEGEEVRERKRGGDGVAEGGAVADVVLRVVERRLKGGVDLVAERAAKRRAEVVRRREQTVHQSLVAGLGHLHDHKGGNDKVDAVGDLRQKRLAEVKVLVADDAVDGKQLERHVEELEHRLARRRPPASSGEAVLPDCTAHSATTNSRRPRGRRGWPAGS